MGLDIGTVKIDYLPRPGGAAYDFAWHLAEECSCASDGNAFGWFEKKEVRKLAQRWLKREPPKSDQEKAEVMTWIKGLPWDEVRMVTLHFNW